MPTHFQKDSLQTYRTAIEIVGKNETWLIDRGVTVLSETGYAMHSGPYDSGAIIVNDGTLSAWQDYGVRLESYNGTIANNGTISGRGGIKGGTGTTVFNLGNVVSYSDSRPAIDIDGRPGDPVTINNSGTITGVTAIRVDGGALVQMANDGDISGAIIFGRGHDRLANTGAISGPVSLGGGNDTFVGTGGAAARVDGGNGRDTIIGGDGDDYLVGGRGNDTVIGGGGNDTLVGCYGKDVLEGGAGSDTFVFLHARNVDRVRDFTPGEDVIQLENLVFRKLGGEGALSAEAFRLGPKAADADDRIIYDPDSGRLTYDKNGDGAGGTTTIAKLAPGLDLSHHHFEII